MTSRELADRIVGQFSGESERADIWRGFEYVLETDAFLNLGYSGRFETHLVGSPQGRLVAQVVDRLAELRGDPRGDRLVDVGCGRGIPTAYATNTHGFDGVGVDLVAHNVALARENVTGGERRPSFVVGDATALPIRDDAMAAAVAIDSIVYVPDKVGAYSELARVLESGGDAVVSDLVVHDRATVDPEVLSRFGDAWDMPVPIPFSAYAEGIERTPLSITAVDDLTDNGVGGFRKWTTAFLTLADGPTGPILRRLLVEARLDASVVIAQIRAAHDALPALRHVLVTLER